MSPVAGVVAKKSAHIRIDTLTELLPDKHKQIWLCLANVLILLVLALVFYHSAKLTLQTQKLTTILKIPYQCVYIAAPISMFLMICHTAVDLAGLLRTARSAD